MTQEQSDRFNEILVKETGDIDISRKVGRFSVTFPPRVHWDNI